VKIEHPGSHLDHLLRQTRQHHVQLSAMADSKANMMLTVASLVITLSLAHLNEPNLRWASLTLIVFCLMTVVAAAYAAMPKVPLISNPQHRPNPANPGFNLLFFGDFANLSYDEYLRTMEAVMNDPNRVYEAQVREVYTLGCFLARKKYRYVRLAYALFISGLFVSGLVFIATEMVG
jgi:hypothetical protein